MPNGLNIKRLLLLISFLGTSITMHAQENFPPNHTDSLHYKVTKIDQKEDQIQRLFIVIDSADVHNAGLIQKIIIEVCTNYTLNSNSRLSFFCCEKFADYKDNLFLGDQTEFGIEDYYKWRDNYYLAEFDFSTKIYTSYPASNGRKLKDKKTEILQGC